MNVEPARPVFPSAFVDERVQEPGRIQPHGILAVTAADALTIDCISENVESWLGIAARELCNGPLTVIIDETDAVAFGASLSEPHTARADARIVTLVGKNGRRLRVESTLHRRDGGGLIVEFEPCESALDTPEYDAAHAPIGRLQSAPTIPAMLAGVARDIRSISGFDRVMVYRFDDEWGADVVAESTARGLPVIHLGNHVAATDIAEQSRRGYMRNPLRLIPDTQYVPVRLIAGNPHESASSPIDLSRATLRSVSPHHLDYLRNIGSRATLTVSIVIRGRLWGLIACHHHEPRLLGFGKRSICELISHLLAWQLDCRMQSEALHERARTVSLQAEINSAVEGASDVGSAIIETAPQIVAVLHADGIAVRIGPIVRRHGAAPPDDAAVMRIASRLDLQAESGIASTDHLAAFAHSRTAASTAAGALLIRLSPDGSTFMLVFRNGLARTMTAHGRETVRDRSRKWTADELEIARALHACINAQLGRLEAQRGTWDAPNGAYLEPRTAQAAALIKLQENVAAALPSRSAVLDVVLAFAKAQTGADGAVIEAFSANEIIYEAAIGMLAPYVGTHLPRTGSFSETSVRLGAPLIWGDTASETDSLERDLCRRAGIASMLAMPIVISEATTIVLKVVSARRRAFGESDIGRLTLAATNLTSALRAAEEFAGLAAAEQEQRTYARQLRALHTIASATTSNRKDQIDAALHLGLEQLDLNWGFLGVIDHATQELVVENSVSRRGALIIAAGIRTPLDKTVIGLPQSKDVCIVQDVSRLATPPTYSGWSSYIAVPLFIDGKRYGVMGFTSRDVRPQPFSEANIEFIAVAGELIASAVGRSLQREQLETSETRYRALTEAIPQMVWVIDAAGDFEYVNARWTSYTGLTLETSRRAGSANVYDAAGLATIAAGRRVIPPHEFDCEVRVRGSDGTYRWHLVRNVPFRDSAGDPKKWLVTATDIEERKSAEALMAGVHDAALAATEAKSRFLATMSHEIRTPMNAVIGMTELLLLTQLSGEQREYIEIVRDSGQSLLRVLNDILDYSKIEAGKLELENVHFDLGGQIESVVELLRAQFQIKGVRLTTRVALDVPAIVSGDPGRLRQILLNLAGNALKFTPAGGNVHIDVAAAVQDGETVPIHFTVEDTGIGIPPQVVARLFQPFSQGDESTTRKYGGTGLGLSICAQLVALMNGTIGVNSVEGAGSAFWFAIPLRPIRQPAKAHDPRKRGPARAKPVVMRAERILLVEDNEINTFLALKQLQRLGFIVSAVNNGQQAVEAVGAEHFDLVLMDCHMPEMDGFAATRAIRDSEAGSERHLPIVAMTADARTEDHQNCLLAGMDDYISKPTSLDSLRTVLDRWLPTPDRRQNSRNATAAASTSKLGVARLLELFDGDRAAVITLLSAAVGSIKADFARIENCVAAHEAAAVAEAAHRLKGTSASIQAPRLGAIGAAIERAARTPSAKIPPGLLDELREAIDALIIDVDKQSKILETIA